MNSRLVLLLPLNPTQTLNLKDETNSTSCIVSSFYTGDLVHEEQICNL